VADLVNGRSYHFEHTAATELPRVFAELRATPPTQAATLAWAKALQDSQLGHHEWHLNSGRYGKVEGLDEAASPSPAGPSGRLPASQDLERLRAYLHVPFQPIGPVQMPAFSMPYQVTLNKHLHQAREANLTWSIEMGYTSEGLWDETAVRGYDLPLCTAGHDPDAPLETLILNAGWTTWGTYVDDYLPAAFVSRRDLAGARAQVARLAQCMPADLHMPFPPANAAERSLIDLWARTAPPLSSSARTDLRDSVMALLHAMLWEAANEIQNRLPDPIDYIEMRRSTFGSEMLFMLPQLGRQDDLPAGMFVTRTIKSLHAAATDYAMLANDIFSYRKEVECDGERHNAVLLLVKLFALSDQDAVTTTARLMEARLRQFEHIIATELPILCRRHHLDDRALQAMNTYVQRLRDFIAAVFHWHLHTSRYRAAELARTRQPWRGCSGLGTSAARLFACRPASTIRPQSGATSIYQ
jgi:germacradienol/geosmin synthase